MAGLGALYLVVLGLLLPVLGFAWVLDSLNLAHFGLSHKAGDTDQALLVAVIATIFLLVLKTAREVEEIKNLVATFSRQDQVR